MHSSSQKSVKASKHHNIHVFDLLNYRLPSSGWVSILHRVSGILLILSLPFLIALLLDKSLTSEVSYADFQYWMYQPWVRLLLSVLLWAYLHHFCAGIRFLLLDTHIGVKKQSAKTSALWVLCISLTLTLLLCARLWGVF
jgi:succinate dehydrogenase / fumarate reductase cytochrome b subunit